jgi:hypothetical protein
MRLRTHLLLTALAVVAAGTIPAHAADNDVIIKVALSAAPAAVAKDAAVLSFVDTMQPVVLKKGTNGFTCMADDPSTPTDDPMCADENSMLWVQAWMNKTAPPEGKVGVSYMLRGGTVADNTDPFATKPPPGKKWQEDGPHMMIFNAKVLADAYPHTGADPDVTQPYVMFPGTPYAHLMVPVKP